MADSQIVPGGCLCGAVRFEVETPTRFCAHCHCSMCRKAHGAGYVTWFAVKRSQLRFLSGEDQLKTYRSSRHGIRRFCGVCGSSMFCELDTNPDDVDVVLAAMDGPIDRLPNAHVYYDSGAAWAQLDEELPRRGGETGVEPLKDD